MTRKVIVSDRMRTGYAYERVARPGRDFDPAFTPDLTPAEMLEMGVFGGRYMTDCRAEFPASWISKRPGCRRSARTRRSIIFVSMPASRSRCGGQRGGSIPTIRAAGFSGTAATTKAAGWARRRGGSGGTGQRGGSRGPAPDRPLARMRPRRPGPQGLRSIWDVCAEEVYGYQGIRGVRAPPHNTAARDGRVGRTQLTGSGLYGGTVVVAEVKKAAGRPLLPPPPAPGPAALGLRQPPDLAARRCARQDLAGFEQALQAGH